MYINYGYIRDLNLFKLSQKKSKLFIELLEINTQFIGANRL